MKIARRAVLVAATVGVVAGCGAPLTVGADSYQGVSMGRPATFAWDEPDGLPTGDPRLDNNPFFVQRLHDAIEPELAARGIRYDDTGHPGLLVHHHVSVQDRVEVIALDRAAGYVESQYGPGTQVIQYDEGTWLVDVADAATKTMFWRGWSRTDLTGVVGDQKCLNDLVDKSVAKMFELFPVAVTNAAPAAPMPEPPAPPACPARYTN